MVQKPSQSINGADKHLGDISSEELERLRRTEERFKAFINCAPIGITSSLLDGRVIEANDAYLEMIGYSRDELESGKISWAELTPLEFSSRDNAAINEAKITGKCRAFEKECITQSGTRIPILVGFALVGPDHSETLAFTVDLSAQKQAEEEVRRLNSELEERVATRTAELEAFCYSVSHDLRAPLRSIDGFAYALLQDYEDKLDEEGVDFVSRIRNSSKRMDELITALLSLSRLTTAQLEHQEVDLSSLAESVAIELRQSAPLRTIEFSIQDDMAVRGDQRMLRAVLENLLNNAVKFTAKRPKAEISFGREGVSGPFFVKDNGVGFDMAQSAKLFQPFERLHSPKEFSGSGIGLATVYRIIRKHGGSIWAKAAVDEGATFFFTLTPDTIKDNDKV